VSATPPLPAHGAVAPADGAAARALAHPPVTLIAAVARGGAIGRDGGLLVHLREDLQHFKRTTLGAPVIMGRRTWESLPPRSRPLPGRRNLVLSRDPAWRAEGAEPVGSLADALDRLRGEPRAFVIGGAQVYAEALPLAQALVLTEIDAAFEADSHFPAFGSAEFQEVARERHTSESGLRFDFVTYHRRSGATPPA
jgi:dihydrofolate reductase